VYEPGQGHPDATADAASSAGKLFSSKLYDIMHLLAKAAQ
jgi:hypothetical protein